MLSGIEIDRLVEQSQQYDRENVHIPPDKRYPRSSSVKVFEYLNIVPYNFSQCNPHSYNLTVADKIRIYRAAEPLHNWYREVARHGAAIFSGNVPPLPQPLDPDKDNEVIDLEFPETGITLYPGIVYLASTVEHIRAIGLAPQVDGRSSYGRLSLIVHLTAGYIDSGFHGHYTLELAVIQPVTLYPFRQICQVCFARVDGQTVHYVGKYNGQVEPTASRSHKDKKS